VAHGRRIAATSRREYGGGRSTHRGISRTLVPEGSRLPPGLSQKQPLLPLFSSPEKDGRIG